MLAAWGYSDCRVTAAVDRIKDRLYIDLTGPYWPPERALLDAGYSTLDFPFEEIQSPQIPMVMQWNAAEFLAYLRSWSATQRYFGTLGQDPVSLIEPDLIAAWGDPTLRRDVRWDFHLRVGRMP